MIKACRRLHGFSAGNTASSGQVHEGISGNTVEDPNKFARGDSENGREFDGFGEGNNRICSNHWLQQ